MHNIHAVKHKSPAQTNFSHILSVFLFWAKVEPAPRAWKDCKKRKKFKFATEFRFKYWKRNCAGKFTWGGHKGPTNCFSINTSSNKFKYLLFDCLKPVPISSQKNFQICCSSTIMSHDLSSTTVTVAFWVSAKVNIVKKIVAKNQTYTICLPVFESLQIIINWFANGIIRLLKSKTFVNQTDFKIWIIFAADRLSHTQAVLRLSHTHKLLHLFY